MWPSDVATVSVRGVVRVEVGMVEANLLELSNFAPVGHALHNHGYLLGGAP